MTCLQPGQRIPTFSLAAANIPCTVSSEECRGRPTVLIVLPNGSPDQLVERLGQFQTRLLNSPGGPVNLVGLSDADPGELNQLANRLGLSFPVASEPSRALCRALGVEDGGRVLPTVFLLDGQGIIRRVYESGQYPDLPNPAMVVRALIHAVVGPRPSPVTSQDWIWGSADASVVLIEYSDYECVHCAELHKQLHGLLPNLRGVALVHRHLPLRASHPHAQTAAEAAEAAGAQGRFWDMHHRLFEGREKLESSDLIEYARELGLDVERLTADLDSHKFKANVDADFTVAVQNGIKVPPTLFVNGILWEGERTEAALRASLERLLAKPNSQACS